MILIRYYNIDGPLTISKNKIETLKTVRISTLRKIKRIRKKTISSKKEFCILIKKKNVISKFIQEKYWTNNIERITH